MLASNTRANGPSGRAVLDEAHLLTLYSELPYPVVMADAAGMIVSANRAACRVLQRPEGQLLGLPASDLVRPGDPRLAGLVTQCSRDGTCNGELTLLRADGSAFEAEVASARLPGAGQALTGLVFRDISKRKRAEARANEQAHWLDKANEAIVVSDAAHRITYWNHGAERMVGWTAREVLGQTLDELVARSGICDPAAKEACGRICDWRGTLHCRGRDGAPQVLAVSVTVLRDEQGSATGQLCIATNITEYSRLKEKYERSLRLHSVGMLAAGVAHDLNNILTPISLGVPLLRDVVRECDDIQLLDTMQASVARATALLRQVLGFTKGMGGQPRLIEARHVLREVAGIVRETFRRSILVEESIPADLWPVMANPTQLHQVLLNLCVNARDAMPDGGVLRLGGRSCILDASTAARIRGGRIGAWLVLFVEDTGTGIAPELLAHIWEPVFTTKPGSEGTGLGLSTVREIVESHAGFVTVQSTVGSGSTFEVYLPAVVSGLPEEVLTESAIAHRGSGEVILVVDDECGVREVAKKLLAKAGYRVATAMNGAAALAAVRACAEEIHLVLTDIDMPGSDGMRLAESVRAIRPSLPIVGMSGLSDEGTATGSPRFSGEILLKPFAGESLLSAVRHVLDHAQRSEREHSTHGVTHSAAFADVAGSRRAGGGAVGWDERHHDPESGEAARDR